MTPELASRALLVMACPWVHAPIAVGCAEVRARQEAGE